MVISHLHAHKISWDPSKRYDGTGCEHFIVKCNFWRIGINVNIDIDELITEAKEQKQVFKFYI